MATLKDLKIFIDPGHGGKDAGSSRNGVKEKDITLAISKKLATLLKNNNVPHQLSRTSDKDLELSDITRSSNRYGADIFVSIHVNACDDEVSNASGPIIFYHPDASTYSENLANTVKTKLVNAIGPGNRYTNIETARWKVLNYTLNNSWGILIETGFICNKNDRENLQKSWYQQKIAQAIYNGLSKFVFDNFKNQTF